MAYLLSAIGLSLPTPIDILSLGVPYTYTRLLITLKNKLKIITEDFFMSYKMIIFNYK